MKIDFTLKDFIKYIIFIGIFYSLLQLIPTQPIDKKDMLLIIVITSLVFIIFDYYSCIELLTNMANKETMYDTKDDKPIDPQIKARYDELLKSRNLQTDSSGGVIFDNISKNIKFADEDIPDEQKMIEDEYNRDHDNAKRISALSKLDELKKLLQKDSIKNEFINKKKTWDNFTKNLSPELQLLIKEKNMKSDLYSDFINSELSWNNFVKTLSPQLQSMIKNNNNFFSEYNTSKNTWNKFLSSLSPELSNVIKTPVDFEKININDTKSNDINDIKSNDINDIKSNDIKSNDTYDTNDYDTVKYDNNKDTIVTGCGNEIEKLKNDVKNKISGLQNKIKSLENRPISEYTEKYMNFLISNLYENNILDQTDLDNIKSKLQSKISTIDDTITSLEKLKLTAKPKANNKSSDKSYEKIYTDLPLDNYNPLGNGLNKWTNEYSILNTNKWQVPMPRPPVCINTTPCKVCPDVESTGYPLSLSDWDSSRKVSNISINKSWANDQVDTSLL